MEIKGIFETKKVDSTLCNLRLEKEYSQSDTSDFNIPTFVINLDRSRERFLKIKNLLDEISVPFERISAVDGKSLSNEEFFEHYSKELNAKNYFIPLRDGEIGCYLSHIKIWKEIVARNLDYALILEDDANPYPLIKYLPKILENIEDMWDFIKLANPGKKKRINSEKTINIGDKRKFKIVTWNKPPITTLAQVVTKNAATKLLKIREKFGRPVDVDLQHVWEHELKIIGILPELVHTDANAESTIIRRETKLTPKVARLKYKAKYSFNLFCYSSLKRGFHMKESHHV